MFKWNPFSMHGMNPGMHRFIGGGGNKSSSKPVQVPTQTTSQLEALDILGKKIKEGLTSGVPAYPGNMYVPRTTEESSYFASVPGLANEVGAMRANLGDVAWLQDPAKLEEFYQRSIRDPAMYEFENITKPLIQEQYAGPGYWGSARANAVSEAGQELAMSLAASKAKLAWEDELAYRQALESAAQREAQYGAAYANEQEELLGTAGMYSRQIEQEKVLADLQRWLMGETVEGVTPTQTNPFLQLAFQFLSIDPYSVGQKSSSTGWNASVTY